MMRVRRRWTAEEDRILSREVMLQSENGVVKQWNLIAVSLPGRTNKDCRKRWIKLGNGVKKGAWSRAEDVELQNAVRELGFRWTQVAERVRTRHAEQCAKRWQHSLDPNVDHSKWEPHDDKLLIACFNKHGRNWKEIRQESFPSRSTTDIKNRHTMLTRKQQQTPGIAESSLSTPPAFAEQEISDDSDSELESDALDSIDFSASDMPLTNQSHMLQEPTFGDHISPDHQQPNFDNNLTPNPRMQLPQVPFPHEEPFLSSSNNDNFFWQDNFQTTALNPLWPGGLTAIESDDKMATDQTGDWSGELGRTADGTSSSRTILILEDVQPETLKTVMFTLFETKTKLTMRTCE